MFQLNDTNGNLFDSINVVVIHIFCRYLLYKSLGQQVLNKLSKVLTYNSLMEEGHPAVHQADNRWSPVSSQLVSQATFIAHVHNANAHT